MSLHPQDFKYVPVTPPGALIDNTSATTASIDTQGYDYATIIVQLGATDIALTALKVQYSDTDGSYGDLTGAIYGTSANIAGTTSSLPSATDDNKAYAFEIDLRGKKRYLDVVCTFGDGTAGGYVCIGALLWKGDLTPQTATERGFGDILRV